MKSTVSEKGQVTIPKEVRDKLGLKAGVVVDFETRDGLLIGRKRRHPGALDSVVGILPAMDVDKALEEMRGKRWNAAEDAPRAKRRR